MVLLTALPVATAQTSGASTPTSLYFHIFDTFTAFPINTQPPDVSFFEVGGTSFPTIASQGFQFNTIRGFATAGPVEYDFIESGRPRFHLEPGIAQAVQLDKGAGATTTLYFDVRDLVGLDNLPNAMPSLTVSVAVRSGNSLASDEVLDNGEMILHGTRTAHLADATVCVPDPVTLEPSMCQNGNAAIAGQSDPLGTAVLVPDEQGVVAFAIPMTFDRPIIPKEAYNVRVDWWQNPTGDASLDGELAAGFIRLVSDATHHPRLDLAVLNPIFIEYIHPEVAAGILLIHTAVNSPWGTYDVDVANMTVAVTGPAVPATLQKVTSQNAHVHNLHDRAAEVTWLWRFREESAPVGEYSLKLTVPNLAGSAQVVDTAGFKVEPTRAVGIDENSNTVTNTRAPSGGAQSSPGAGLLVALALLGCAAAVRLRRRLP